MPKSYGGQRGSLSKATEFSAVGNEMSLPCFGGLALIGRRVVEFMIDNHQSGTGQVANYPRRAYVILI